MATANENQRIEIVDALRGFALFGMLIANIGVFTTSDVSGTLNELAAGVHGIAFLNNFYVIFSVLFGLSFYIFMSRPANTLYTFVKRTWILLLIGLFHMLFLWHLDILHAYALAGFLLIFFYRLNPGSLKIWIAVMFLLDVIISLFFSTAALDFLVHVPEFSIEESYTAESYLSNLTMTCSYLPTLFVSTLTNLPHYLFFFLIGLYLGKSELFVKTGEKIKEIKGCCYFFVIATVLIMVAWMILEHYQLSNGLTDVAGSMFNISLSFFYISYFTLVYDLWKNSFVFKRLTYAGKMTLTSYLTHSLFYLVIFYEFNLGFYLALPDYYIPLLAIPLFFIQSEFSRIWLHKFGRGPVESLWRKLTYSNLSTIKSSISR